MTESRRKKLIIIAVIFGAFVLLDIILRIAGAGVPPSTYCEDGGSRNKAGYEPRNFYANSPLEENGRYIVCFGDSWTYGLGVEQKDTWPSQLETKLRLKNTNVRVVNLAVANATTANVVSNFVPQMKRYGSQQAIVFIGLQDATPVDLLKRYPLADPLVTESCSRPWWRLGHWLGQRRLAVKLSIESPDPPDNKEYLKRRGTVAETQMLLFHLVQLAKENRIQLLFVTYPSLLKKKGSNALLPLESRYNFLIHTTAASFNARLCDLEKRWGDDTEQYLLDWMLWPHPNEKGHADIAQAIAEIW